MEVGGARSPGLEDEPVARGAKVGEAGTGGSADFRVAQRRRSQDQAAGWHGVQDARPDGENGVVELGEGVEATEGDGAGQKRRERCDFDLRQRWAEAVVDLGQAPDGLDEMGLVSRRDDVRVSDDVVDLARPVVAK